MKLDINPTVDRLAQIKARITELQAEETLLKAEVIDTALHAQAQVLTGTTHRASVSLCEGRTVIDWAAIAAKLNPSRQLVTAHTSVGDPYYTVRVSAHKTSK